MFWPAINGRKLLFCFIENKKSIDQQRFGQTIHNKDTLDVTKVRQVGMKQEVCMVVCEQSVLSFGTTLAMNQVIWVI